MTPKAKRARAAFWRRYQRDGVPSMDQEEFGEWVNGLPIVEFFAMIDAHKPQVRRLARKPEPKRAPSKPPTPVKSIELCKRLSCIAAFNLYGETKAQAAIYETIRTLQRLDAAAIEAGIVLADA